MPCARVLDAASRRADPHFARRRTFLDEPMRRKGFPLVLDGWIPPSPALSPAVGEHNAAVLGRSLRDLGVREALPTLDDIPTDIGRTTC